ncbi:MAG: hypothetical protein JW900_05110 [Anaerolineae bacterium]|nr:hypothetical protein [Anaerolineae bacterium]
MSRGLILLALLLILVGIYSLLMQVGLQVPQWDRLWPVFPFAGGLAMLFIYFRSRRRDHGQVLFGSGLTLTGLVFFFITLREQDYTILETWWPVFIVIGGISFLAYWLAQGLRDWGALLLAIAGLVFGAICLTVKLELLEAVTQHELVRLWPAALIIVGLLLLLCGVWGRKKGE